MATRYIKGLETVVSVLFTNNAQVKCTMNEKFSILHEVASGGIEVHCTFSMGVICEQKLNLNTVHAYLFVYSLFTCKY